jgi:hypothetical protein
MLPFSLQAKAWLKPPGRVSVSWQDSAVSPGRSTDCNPSGGCGGVGGAQIVVVQTGQKYPGAHPGCSLPRQ